MTLNLNLITLTLTLTLTLTHILRMQFLGTCGCLVGLRSFAAQVARTLSRTLALALTLALTPTLALTRTLALAFTSTQTLPRTLS